MEHVRIDEGIERGPRPKPNQIETQARNEAGQFLTRYTPELKAQAIEKALVVLECGGRIEELADELSIPRATLYSWLIGYDVGRARTLFFDGQCAASLDDIARATQPLDLTRAREYLAGWIKVAERRDPRSYALQKAEISINTNGPVSVQILSFAVDAQQQLPQIAQITGNSDDKPM